MIEAFSQQNDIFIPLSVQKWEALLHEIFENNKIADVDISQAYMKPLLYHFYCLKNIQGPSDDCTIEVDHIIPKDIFKSSTLKRKEVIAENLLNLGLLPKNENCSKGSKRLVEIVDPWMKDQIKKYEFIDKADFVRFSDLNYLEQFFDIRKDLFLEAFQEKRNAILSN